MGMRAYGSGTISFGLVSVPVKLYSTVDSTHAVKFNMMSPTGNKLKQQYIDPETEDVIEYADRKKGYEFSKGQYVVFDADEVKAIKAIESNNAISISEFVDASEIDRLLVEKSYYLGPDSKGPSKAFHLLRAAIAKTGKVAIARYASRGKENLVAIRNLGDGMVLEQLKLAEEVRAQEGVNLDVVEVSDVEVSMAVMLIEQQTAESFDHSKYRDEVRERVLAMVQDKVQNGTISDTNEKVEAAPKSNENDLLNMLKASVEASQAA